MKIALCFKEVIDASLELGYGRVSPALFNKGLIRRLDPADLDCLALALALKKETRVEEVLLMSLGPERVESYLREGLAAGADKALRLWDGAFEEMSLSQKARCLGRAVGIAGADLVLCGSASLDSGRGVFAGLLAACLGRPFVTEVEDLHFNSNSDGLKVERALERGRRESLELTLPAVLGVKARGRNWPAASLDQLLRSQEGKIEVLDLPGLGLSLAEINGEPAREGSWSFPRPPLKFAPLDSSLPAFERILALLEGGISPRQGEMLQGDSAALAEQLFQILLKEEVLKTKTGR